MVDGFNVTYYTMCIIHIVTIMVPRFLHKAPWRRDGCVKMAALLESVFSVDSPMANCPRSHHACLSVGTHFKWWRWRTWWPCSVRSSSHPVPSSPGEELESSTAKCREVAEREKSEHSAASLLQHAGPGASALKSDGRIFRGRSDVMSIRLDIKAAAARAQL